MLRCAACGRGMCTKRGRTTASGTSIRQRDPLDINAIKARQEVDRINRFNSSEEERHRTNTRVEGNNPGAPPLGAQAVARHPALSVSRRASASSFGSERLKSSPIAIHFQRVRYAFFFRPLPVPRLPVTNRSGLSRAGAGSAIRFTRVVRAGCSRRRRESREKSRDSD